MAKLQILDGVTATNSAPSGATAGFKLWRSQVYGEGLFRGTDKAIVVIDGDVTTSQAGSVTIKLWGYSGLDSQWHPLGTSATDSSKGLLNEENAMGETIADRIQHSEIVQGLRPFDRIYAEVTAIANMDGVDCWLMAVAGEVKSPSN